MRLPFCGDGILLVLSPLLKEGRLFTAERVDSIDSDQQNFLQLVLYLLPETYTEQFVFRIILQALRTGKICRFAFH
jgi:hypothetical protein